MDGDKKISGGREMPPRYDSPVAPKSPGGRTFSIRKKKPLFPPSPQGAVTPAPIPLIKTNSGLSAASSGSNFVPVTRIGLSDKNRSFKKLIARKPSLKDDGEEEQQGKGRNGYAKQASFEGVASPFRSSQANNSPPNTSAKDEEANTPARDSSNKESADVNANRQDQMEGDNYKDEPRCGHDETGGKLDMLYSESENELGDGRQTDGSSHLFRSDDSFSDVYDTDVTRSVYGTDASTSVYDTEIGTDLSKSEYETDVTERKNRSRSRDYDTDEVRSASGPSEYDTDGTGTDLSRSVYETDATSSTFDSYSPRRGRRLSRDGRRRRRNDLSRDPITQRGGSHQESRRDRPRRESRDDRPRREPRDDRLRRESRDARSRRLERRRRLSTRDENDDESDDNEEPQRKVSRDEDSRGGRTKYSTRVLNAERGGTLRTTHSSDTDNSTENKDGKTARADSSPGRLLDMSSQHVRPRSTSKREAPNQFRASDWTPFPEDREWKAFSSTDFACYRAAYDANASVQGSVRQLKKCDTPVADNLSRHAKTGPVEPPNDQEKLDFIDNNEIVIHKMSKIKVDETNEKKATRRLKFWKKRKDAEKMKREVVWNVR